MRVSALLIVLLTAFGIGCSDDSANKESDKMVHSMSNLSLGMDFVSAKKVLDDQGIQPIEDTSAFSSEGKLSFRLFRLGENVSGDALFLGASREKVDGPTKVATIYWHANWKADATVSKALRKDKIVYVDQVDLAVLRLSGPEKIIHRSIKTPNPFGE